MCTLSVGITSCCDGLDGFVRLLLCRFNGIILNFDLSPLDRLDFALLNRRTRFRDLKSLELNIQKCQYFNKNAFLVENKNNSQLSLC